MAGALAIFSVLIIAMSLYGVVAPTGILTFARRFIVGPGIWIATGIRILLALLLGSTAPLCRTPAVFLVLGTIVFLAAVTLPAMSAARRIRLFERLESWPVIVVRLQGIIGVGFGLLILWSIWPAMTAN